MTATAKVDRVQAHDDERDAVGAVTRFTATGLRLGYKVICFTDTVTPRALRAHFEDVGVPTERALAVGQLRIVPALKSYFNLLSGGRLATEPMIDSLVGEITRAHREGYPGLRLAGDMGWILRTGTSVDDLRRYEAQANRLFLDRRVAGICLYDRRRFPAEQLRAVAAAHPGTVGPHADRAWTPLLRAYRTADPPGLPLVGQVDRTTANGLVHEGLFYTDAARLSAGTVPFVLDGLAAGKPVLVAATGPQLELVRAAMGPTGDAVRYADTTEAGNTVRLHIPREPLG